METSSSSLGERKCERCGKLFRPKESRHRQCYDCFTKSRSGGSSPSASPGGGPAQPARFDAYLEKLRTGGYFDERKNLRAELRVEDADMVAHVLAEAGVTAGQLRRFFTMARSLESRLGFVNDFPAIVPEIASLQPFAASIIGREQNQGLRTRLGALRSFIDTNAQRARESEHAFRNGFLPHFESVVAYFTLYKPR
jgi:CRISPR type III-A-associated protein Csm2